MTSPPSCGRPCPTPSGTPDAGTVDVHITVTDQPVDAAGPGRWKQASVTPTAAAARPNMRRRAETHQGTLLHPTPHPAAAPTSPSPPALPTPTPAAEPHPTATP